MKAYGYSNSVDVEGGPLSLSEVSFCGTPEALRKVAMFLNEMAEAMEGNHKFGHSHLRDMCPEWGEDSADVIVVKQIDGSSI